MQSIFQLMPSLIQRIKFAWKYFMSGRRRIPQGPRLDVHSDPLVGEYVRTTIGTWWADAPLAGLAHKVRLIAPGSQPTNEQLGRFEALVHRLPALIQLSRLEDAPVDDGWGNPPPPFNIHSAPVSNIHMHADGSFYLIFEVKPDGVYMLAPGFEISPDLELVSAAWSV